MPSLILKSDASNIIQFRQNGTNKIGGRPYNIIGGVTGSYFNDSSSISTREIVDSNTLLAEDFWRNGVGGWYSQSCDDANAAGGLYRDGMEGWCGTIYASGTLSERPGAVINLGGGEYAGATGYMSGVSNGNMADRGLTEAVTELWVRYYIKPLSGYTFGAEKVLTFNAGSVGGAGIKWGNFSWNCAAGSASASGSCTMGFPAPGEDVCDGQNYSITSDHWHCFIIRMKLNDIYPNANGEFEFWADDCGTGTLPVNPGGSPTQRFLRTDVTYNRNDTSEKITTLWFECWSNPESTGERYWRSIYASKASVGFATNP